MKPIYRGLLIIYCMVALATGYIFYQRHIEDENLDNIGIRTNGILYPEYTSVRKSGAVWYIVKYKFMAEGIVYEGESRIVKEPTEEKVTVIYDPNNPANNCLESGDKTSWQIRYSRVLLVLVLMVPGLYLARKIETKYKHIFTHKNGST